MTNGCRELITINNFVIDTIVIIGSSPTDEHYFIAIQELVLRLSFGIFELLRCQCREHFRENNYPAVFKNFEKEES